MRGSDACSQCNAAKQSRALTFDIRYPLPPLCPKPRTSPSSHLAPCIGLDSPGNVSLSASSNPSLGPPCALPTSA
eukprot:2254331-Rhodomonas_salina.1